MGAVEIKIDGENFWEDKDAGKTCLDVEFAKIFNDEVKHNSDEKDIIISTRENTTIRIYKKSKLSNNEEGFLKIQLKILNSIFGKVYVDDILQTQEYENFDTLKSDLLYYNNKVNGLNSIYFKVKNFDAYFSANNIYQDSNKKEGREAVFDTVILLKNSEVTKNITSKNEKNRKELKDKIDENYRTKENIPFGSISALIAFVTSSGSWPAGDYEYIGSDLLRYGIELFTIADRSKYIIKKEAGSIKEGKSDDTLSTKSKALNAYNTIFFGAPGTGKSYEIQNKVEKNFNVVKRITFYPSLTYGSFVGCFKPYPKNGGEITYKYVAGPLMQMIARALKNSGENFLLIIEEINRANAAACFGDTFQLLDRDSDGNSQYPIKTSEEQEDWLNGEKVNSPETLIFPSNLYIIATMNASDEGVMPLDTAFKRRFDFHYMDIDSGANEVDGLKIGGISWNEIRKAINKMLGNIGVNEDKMLGAFFLGTEQNGLKERFVNKVLMYLFEDIGRIYRNKIFADGINTFSELKSEFKAKGFNIFKDEDLKKLTKDGDEVESKFDSTNQEELQAPQEQDENS